MLAILRFFSSLSLALWLGGLFFFSAIVAPAAFSVLPTRTLAGNMVGQALAGMTTLGYVCACVLLFSYLGRAFCEPPKRRVIAKALIAGVALALSLVSAYGVTPPMAVLRAQVQGIENLPPSDSRKHEFDTLHHMSVLLMGFELLGVLTLLALEQVPAMKKPV
jgi:hypothetical protein